MIHENTFCAPLHAGHCLIGALEKLVLLEKAHMPKNSIRMTTFLDNDGKTQDDKIQISSPSCPEASFDCWGCDNFVLHDSEPRTRRLECILRRTEPSRTRQVK